MNPPKDTTESISTLSVAEIISRKGRGYIPNINVITAKGITVNNSRLLISGRSLYFSFAGRKKIRWNAH